MISDRELARLQDLTDNASPLPWEVEEYDRYDGYAVYIDDGGIGTAYVAQDIGQGLSEGKHDAAFIAEARTAVPELIADVKELRARIETARRRTLNTLDPLIVGVEKQGIIDALDGKT